MQEHNHVFYHSSGILFLFVLFVTYGSFVPSIVHEQKQGQQLFVFILFYLDLILSHGSLVHNIVHKQKHGQHFIFILFIIILIGLMAHLCMVLSMNSNMGSILILACFLFNLYILIELMAHLYTVSSIISKMDNISFIFFFLVSFHLIHGSLVLGPLKAT
jgi:hypothetical protein